MDLLDGVGTAAVLVNLLEEGRHLFCHEGRVHVGDEADGEFPHNLSGDDCLGSLTVKRTFNAWK